jgi:hypothetical protein
MVAGRDCGVSPKAKRKESTVTGVSGGFEESCGVLERE